jgi:hypothetical protein
MDEARQGELAAASESIEAQTRARSQRVSNSQIIETVPGGNAADGSRATQTKPVRVSERERANQSKPRHAHVPRESQTRKIIETVPGGNRTHMSGRNASQKAGR